MAWKTRLVARKGLTRARLGCAEAQDRTRLVEILSYAVDLDLTGDDEVLGPATVIRFSCREPGAGTFAELEPAVVRRVLSSIPAMPAPRPAAGPCVRDWYRKHAPGC